MACAIQEFTGRLARWTCSICKRQFWISFRLPTWVTLVVGDVVLLDPLDPDCPQACPLCKTVFDDWKQLA